MASPAATRDALPATAEAGALPSPEVCERARLSRDAEFINGAVLHVDGGIAASA